VLTTSPPAASTSSDPCRRTSALHLPRATWHELRTLLPIAASCFAIIVAQSAAAARIFADRHRERVDENADILGLAAANAAAAVSGAFVVNGSVTQTAMGERAGCESQIAQLAPRPW
jgi:MFS superfamily sulfate permease-like transporter